MDGWKDVCGITCTSYPRCFLGPMGEVSSLCLLVPCLNGSNCGNPWLVKYIGFSRNAIYTSHICECSKKQRSPGVTTPNNKDSVNLFWICSCWSGGGAISSIQLLSKGSYALFLLENYPYLLTIAMKRWKSAVGALDRPFEHENHWEVETVKFRPDEDIFFQVQVKRSYSLKYILLSMFAPSIVCTMHGKWTSNGYSFIIMLTHSCDRSNNDCGEKCPEQPRWTERLILPLTFTPLHHEFLWCCICLKRLSMGKEKRLCSFLVLPFIFKTGFRPLFVSQREGHYNSFLNPTSLSLPILFSCVAKSRALSSSFSDERLRSALCPCFLFCPHLRNHDVTSYARSVGKA